MALGFFENIRNSDQFIAHNFPKVWVFFIEDI